MSEKKPLPDIQNQSDKRKIKLKWVGVEDVTLPFALLAKDRRTVVPIESKIKVAVGLPHNYKGTHMSRFIEVVEKYSLPFFELNSKSTEINYFGGKQIQKLLEELKDKLKAEDAFLKMDFTYFVAKEAPVSKQSGILDYRCSFEGHLLEDEFNFFITVEVPFMSVCPCSKEISDYGAHNQRGYARIKIKSPTENFVWIEDLIDIVEKSGSCEIYSLLKRPDEKWVTERSYENPKFVEDVTRDVAVALSKANIVSYEIEVKTIESIHNHQAFAFTDSETIEGVMNANDNSR